MAEKYVRLVDKLTVEVRRKSPWIIMFADDIVICSESRQGL